MIFRVYYRITPKHVSCRLRVARDVNQTFAYCGHFMVRVGEEFDALREVFQAQFIEDEEESS